MAQKILVIGGVALGPKAACRCKRMDPDAEVTMIDENVYISYGGCGMPFYLSGEVNNINELRATPYNRVRDAGFFAELKGVSVRTQTRALSIEREAKRVLVEDVVSKKQEYLSYDKLVLATGASARMPQVDGVELENIFAVTRLEAAESIRKACEAGEVKQAVIVGAGFIGLECAVSLADMWGIDVSLVEMAEGILPMALSKTLGAMAENHCRENGVAVYTAEKVLRFEGDGGKVCRVVTDKRELEAQLVIVAAGFVPNGQLASAAGIEVAPFGAVVVNEYMQTTDPAIYAGGDCVAVKNLITDKVGYIPLGSMANRQGRVIGTNVAVGNKAHFKGYVGTWGVKLFEMTFCGTGLTEGQAKVAGFDAQAVSVEQLDRAHFYPEKDLMSLEIVVERGTERVLGMQGASHMGDAVKARIDAVAAALQMAKPNLEDISNLEVAYTPPLASAMDVVNTVANVAENMLAGRIRAITPQEFAGLWQGRKGADKEPFFIDARPAAAAKAAEAIEPDLHAIGLEEMEKRVGEVPKDRPVVFICNTGLRAYDCALILAKHGYTDVSNTQGGIQAVMKQGLLDSEVFKKAK